MPIMNPVYLSLLFLLLIKNGPQVVNTQISFGEPTPANVETKTETTVDTKKTENINATIGTRLNANGLLADSLGYHPLGENGQGKQNEDFSLPQGRVPQNYEYASCCCSVNEFCPNVRDDGDFDGIKPRRPDDVEDDISKLSSSIGVRIVNNPPEDVDPDRNQFSCPFGQELCCYDGQKVNTNSFGSTCRAPTTQPPVSQWTQGCRARVPNVGGKKCGQRNFSPLFNLEKGQASPEEFPWICMMLTDKDRFLGSCAIVPEETNNDITRGTRKVITAAHKLLALKKSEALKVRIIEYDGRGFEDTERNPHQDIIVTRVITHPDFNDKRLSNDIAVLTLEKTINLLRTRGVNAACYPGCSNMFDHRFNNDTGVRCWVAGWGRDAEDGQFSFIQRKVDVPIYERNRCNIRIKQELQKTNPNGNSASRFNLQPGELCAGGETGKDACDGDGGSPLVCLSKEGHWHVVGLVAWGVGCANPDTPGIYVNVHNYLDFITNSG